MTIDGKGGRLRCLAVGAITEDRYGQELRIGGSAYYAARVFSALGAAPLAATNAPREMAGREELASVELFFAGDEPAPVFVNEYAGRSGRRQWIERAASEIAPRELPESWSDVDALFLCPVLGEVPPEPWLRRVRARVVGVGMQGFLRAAGPEAAGGSRRPVVPARPAMEVSTIRGAHAAFLSEEDLALAAPDLLDDLRASIPLVFLTRGEAGARIFREGGVTEIGVFPTRAVDPTGAGDAFAAACLLALTEGADPESAARLGAAAASIVVEGVAGECLSRIGEGRARAVRVSRSQ
jgi:1D-myo-inositol 3-kinase